MTQDSDQLPTQSECFWSDYVRMLSHFLLQDTSYQLNYL